MEKQKATLFSLWVPLTICDIYYLRKYSSRHSLQNLWPHLVRTGSLEGNWHIMQRKSSSIAVTKSSSNPEGKRPFTSAIELCQPECQPESETRKNIGSLCVRTDQLPFVIQACVLVVSVLQARKWYLVTVSVPD